jgi:lysophospholipase L1-like esterase
MPRFVIVAVLALLPSVLTWASTIRRCEDAQGNVVFTNTHAGNDCPVYSGGAASIGSSSSRTVRHQRGDAVEILTKPSRSAAPPPAPLDTPGFIDATQNHFEASRRAVLAPFVARWSAQDTTVRILHLGDSHVRNGFAGEVTRRKLQAVRGNGGSGLVFPYALARTYSPSDYRSTMEGRWQSGSSVRPLAGLALGVAGVAARTTSAPAAFTLTFPQPLPPGRKVVKVFLKSSMPGLRLTASTSGQRVNWDARDTASALTVAEFILYDNIASLRIDIASRAAGGQFELHGVSIEGPRPGVVYQSLGVDGATLDSLNAAPYLEEQLAVLQPDLVVLDFGSNELINSGNVLPPQYEAVVKVIRRLRTARPDVSIVLATPQDMNFQGRNVGTAGAYAQLVRRIAFEHDCLFWDWYRIAGGPGSMKAWAARGLANRDQVHLVAKGYRLKGELLAEAFLNTLKTQGPSYRFRHLFDSPPGKF